MSDENGYRVKAALRPEDYKHGPVYTFTKEEIDEWLKTAGAVLAKVEAQANMTPEEIMALDNEAFAQSEREFKDLMKGPEAE